MNTFVRRANQADADALRLLEAESREQLARFRGGDRLSIELPVVDEDWPERIDSNNWVVLVAGFDDVQLGYLCLDLATTNGIPLIATVYVTVKVRQLGLGDGLVSAAIETCRQLGVDAIDAFALPGDRETKNLFERSGLTARLLIASRNINDPQMDV